ncbi:hypothetical protein GXP74_16390 [Streptacidiphilus sp. P02-A3a]|nr:hypothetical protein GXP74_16390 [Streptacidiphilus sp. P02-A3a]
MVPPLLAGLCDDAALFPPGNAPVAAAVPAHRGHRAAWYADLVGPFLLGADRIAEVGDAAAGEPLDVVLVVRAGPAALAEALDRLAARPALRLLGVELGPDADGTPADAAARCRDALARELPPGAAGVVELRRPADGDSARGRAALEAALDLLAAAGLRAKYRTGGLEPQAFPSAAELAALVGGCAARALPFKCTAGLHHAVRHTDPATGFTHHGFLNILAATDAALRGAAGGDVAEVLECRQGGELAAALADAPAAPGADTRADALRAVFTAYGTCSVTEPLADLAALGLLTRPDADLPADPTHPDTLDRA